MKKVLTLMLVLIFACVVFLVFVAAKKDTGEDLLLACSTRNSVNEYWLHWFDGAESAAKGLGADYLSISADDDEAKQVADVEAAIVRGVDA